MEHDLDLRLIGDAMSTQLFHVAILRCSVRLHQRRTNSRSPFAVPSQVVFALREIRGGLTR